MYGPGGTGDRSRNHPDTASIQKAVQTETNENCGLWINATVTLLITGNGYGDDGGADGGKTAATTTTTKRGRAAGTGGGGGEGGRRGGQAKLL